MNGQPPQTTPPKKTGAWLFWCALLAPALLALVSFLFASGGPNDLGVAIGLLAALLGLLSSIYCSTWLAHRFINPGKLRILFWLTMIVVIGVVNLIIVVAGCAGNISFR